jgi:hypothetical protein
MAMRQGWLPAATGVAGLAAGVLLSGWWGGEGAAPLAQAARERVAGSLTVEEVRHVVREELAAHGAAPTRGTPPPLGATSEMAVLAPALPTASQTSATQQAESILAAAISRHTWAETDADALRGIFHDMSADQQAETLRQFAMAVNQGRLTPQTERIPF